MIFSVTAQASVEVVMNSIKYIKEIEIFIFRKVTMLKPLATMSRGSQAIFT